MTFPFPSTMRTFQGGLWQVSGSPTSPVVGRIYMTQVSGLLFTMILPLSSVLKNKKNKKKRKRKKEKKYHFMLHCESKPVNIMQDDTSSKWYSIVVLPMGRGWFCYFCTPPQCRQSLESSIGHYSHVYGCGLMTSPEWRPEILFVILCSIGV